MSIITYRNSISILFYVMKLKTIIYSFNRHFNPKIKINILFINNEAVEVFVYVIDLI